MLRKFSSEGALLELDFLPWGERDGLSILSLHPRCKLKRDHSISVENLVDLEKDSGLLKATSLNESFKAAKGSFESVGKCEGQPHSPSSTLKSGHMPVSPRPPHYHRQQARAKLTAAKLHLK
ncbi:hypothetical protein M9458_037333, partial [Cirrhinus mrigala]